MNLDYILLSKRRAGNLNRCCNAFNETWHRLEFSNELNELKSWELARESDGWDRSFELCESFPESKKSLNLKLVWSLNELIWMSIHFSWKVTSACTVRKIRFSKRWVMNVVWWCVGNDANHMKNYVDNEKSFMMRWHFSFFSFLSLGCLCHCLYVCRDGWE